MGLARLELVPLACLVCDLELLEIISHTSYLFIILYEHVAINLTRLGLAAATIENTCSINTACDEVECKRISLTGFCSCTSRSHYQSVSKQTTRISQVTYRRACLMLALEGFPSSL
ncbi:hypothetical protein Tco_1250133 [Tanacetum coccineum]